MKSRFAFIDTLKSLAILGVITIHVCSTPLLQLDITSTDWFFSVFLASIIRWSVPIFLMCSGVLFLNKNKTITIKELFTKYIFRIVCALIFWALFYKLIDILRDYYSFGYINYEDIVCEIHNLLKLKTQTHLYYLYMVILIYALLPIIRVFTNSAGRQEIEYTIVIWFILGVFLPMAFKYYPFARLTGIVRQYPLNMAYSAMGYFVLGHYLQAYTLKKRTTYIIYLLGLMGLIATVGGTILKSSATEVYTDFFEGMSPNIVFMAVALFLFIKNSHNNISSQSKIIQITRYISKASFCIYLIHVAFIDVLEDMSYPIMAASPLVTVTIAVGVVFILSLCMYFLLSKIPLVKKYLI